MASARWRLMAVSAFAAVSMSPRSTRQDLTLERSATVRTRRLLRRPRLGPGLRVPLDRGGAAGGFDRAVADGAWQLLSLGHCGESIRRRREAPAKPVPKARRGAGAPWVLVSAVDRDDVDLVGVGGERGGRLDLPGLEIG